jgi:adhesin/invasin
VDTLTISGIQVRAINGSMLPSAGNILRTGGTATMQGLTSGTNSGSLSQVVGAGSASQSTVAATPTSVAANGSATSTVTVTLVDQFGNPASGKSVKLTAGSGSSKITSVNGATITTVLATTGASGTSSASGQVTFTVTDTVAEGPLTYTATDTSDSNLQVGTAQVTFTAGAVSASTSTVAASPTSVTADGTSTSTITATLKDAMATRSAARASL